MQNIKVLIDLDFDTNEAIKTEFRRKRLMDEKITETKEQVLGKMVKERHDLQAELNRKGWTFEELKYMLNKKKFIQPT
jgi:hypothetical protein